MGLVCGFHFGWVGEFHIYWVFWWIPCVIYCVQGIHIVSCASWVRYWVICVCLWWVSSTIISECFNSTKIMFIVNILLNSVSSPSVLFLVLVLLVPLLDSSHIFLQGCSYLVSCLWVSSRCVGMVKTAGPPLSTAVSLQKRLPCLCLHFRFLSCCFICLWLGL